MEEHFKISLDNGKIGERVVLDYLEGLEDIKQVVNVKDDKRFFQNEDVDFLIRYKDNNFYKIEVKTDFKAHETNNIFYELTTSGNKGCFAKTKADIVYYYIPAVKTLLSINVQAIRRHIENNKQNLRLVNGGDYATGYLIRIDDLEKANILKKIENVY